MTASGFTFVAANERAHVTPEHPDLRTHSRAHTGQQETDK